MYENTIPLNSSYIPNRVLTKIRPTFTICIDFTSTIVFHLKNLTLCTQKMTDRTNKKWQSSEKRMRC